MIVSEPYSGAKLNLPVMRRRAAGPGRSTSLAAAPVMTRLIRDNYASSKRKRRPRKFIEASRDRTSKPHLLKPTSVGSLHSCNKIP